MFRSPDAADNRSVQAATPILTPAVAVKYLNRDSKLRYVYVLSVSFFVFLELTKMEPWVHVIQ